MRKGDWFFKSDKQTNNKDEKKSILLQKKHSDTVNKMKMDIQITIK